MVSIDEVRSLEKEVDIVDSEEKAVVLYKRVFSMLMDVHNESRILNHSEETYKMARGARKKKWYWPANRRDINEKLALIESIYKKICDKYPNIVKKDYFGEKF
jgi:hypothetical protein